MTKELLVALEIAQSELCKSVAKNLAEQAGIKQQVWAGSLGEKGPAAVRTIPDIIIIDDAPAYGELLQRIKTIKNNFPQADLLVISGNRDPQHIINAMKAGAAEYLVEPVNEQTLRNAIEEVRGKLANAGRLARGSIYSFISAKGGVGATVVAVNTAAALALNNNSSAALLDMSFQSGDASVLLDLVPQNTIIDLCRNFHRLDFSFLRGVMFMHKTGLSFLAAPNNPEESEEITSEHVGRILDLARKLYDHVVLDCTSMHINDCSVEAFRYSDKVFLVTDMSVPSIRNTVRLGKLIRKLGTPLEKIEIIVNRFIKGGALSLGEIEKNFDKPVYWLFPNDYADIVSSINRGIPLVKMSSGAPFAKNIDQFSRKIQNILDDPNYRGIRSTFGKSL